MIISTLRCLQAFETALWYPEEIANALWHLYFKIAERFYGRPMTEVARGLRGGILLIGPSHPRHEKNVSLLA